MALSGTVNGKVTHQPSTSNPFSFYFTWSATQNIENNYSDVTVTTYWKTSNTTWDFDTVGNRNASITINGTTTSITKRFNCNPWPSNPYPIQTATTRVYHDADGSKSIAISVRANGSASTWGPSSSVASSGDCTASATITLDTIPRASSFGTISGNTIGGSMTVNISRNSSSFTHQLWYKLGNSNWYDLGSGIGTSKTFTISNDLLSQLPSSTNGTLQLCLRTYNGSTQIGSDIYKNDLTVYVDNNVKPSIPNALSVDPVNITTADGTSRDILVQDKNKITVSVSGCQPGAGSSIKNYKFEVLSGSTVISTQTTTSTSVTLGPFSNTGDLKFRLTVTDNRERSTSNSGREPTCTCYKYGPPSFSSFKVYRCNSSGSADDNGTNIKYELGVGYESVNNTNKSTVKIYYKKSDAATWSVAANALTNSTSKTANAIIKNASGTNITFDSASTYMVYAEVIDNYNISAKYSSITIFGASRVFNIRSNGTGIAVGKMAEKDHLFECKWDAKFDGNLTVGTSTQSDTPTSGITVHDVRGAGIYPDSFGHQNVNFYFDQDETNNKWFSAIHMKGWNDGVNNSDPYAAWELAGNADNGLDDNTLKYRQGAGKTWGAWQTVLTDQNIGNYAAAKSSLSGYLPLSGGTLTGRLALPENLYYTSNSGYGLNCQNSDIINANALYFGDASDSAGEAINFYRDADKWDSLYAANGALKFHPNRSTSSSLGGYQVYHSGNLGTIEIETGTCTLSDTLPAKTITFTTKFSGPPIIMLTPVTTNSGAIPGKVRSRSASQFTAIIGGSANDTDFMWLAMYWKGV